MGDTISLTQYSTQTVLPHEEDGGRLIGPGASALANNQSEGSTFLTAPFFTPAHHHNKTERFLVHVGIINRVN